MKPVNYTPAAHSLKGTETLKNLVAAYAAESMAYSRYMFYASQAEKEGKEEYGESGKEIGNWISTFRKFIKFHDEQIEKVEGDKKVLAEKIEASRLKAANLFLETRFSLWGIDNGLSETTMDSYISGME